MNFRNLVLLFTLWLLLSVWNGCISIPDSYIEKTDWRKLDNEPPTPLELQEMRSSVFNSQIKIRSNLGSTSRYKRREAAHLLEMLGPTGKSIDALFDAYQVEYDSATKAFILRAMSESDDKSPRQSVYLKIEFNDCSSKVLKTYLAGAILKLGNFDTAKIEFQYLLDSLNPRGTVNEMANEITRINFWERRWAAAYMIGKLDKTSAIFIPALEKITETEGIPPWVLKQVWFTLRKTASMK